MYLMNSFNDSFLAVSELTLHCLEYLQLSDTVTNTSVLVATALSSVSETDSLRSSSTDIRVILAQALCNENFVVKSRKN